MVIVGVAPASILPKLQVITLATGGLQVPWEVLRFLMVACVQVV